MLLPGRQPQLPYGQWQSQQPLPAPQQQQPWQQQQQPQQLQQLPPALSDSVMRDWAGISMTAGERRQPLLLRKWPPFERPIICQLPCGAQTVTGSKQQLVTLVPALAGMDWELGEGQSPVDLLDTPQPWQVLQRFGQAASDSDSDSPVPQTCCRMCVAGNPLFSEMSWWRHIFHTGSHPGRVGC